MQRAEKLKLLDGIFNQSNTDSLKSLTRPMFPKILIFRTNGEVMNLSPRLNPTLPAKYQRDLDESELDTMLLTSGNKTTFFLPDNGRD